MDHKAENLHIRTSQAQKASLARAARLKNMNVSQFVLQSSLEAANEVLAAQPLILMGPEEYDAFCKRLDEAPRAIPELQKLFAEPSTFE